MKPETNLILPMHVARAIADYLSTRPWIEVNGLLQTIGALKPIEETPDEH